MEKRGFTKEESLALKGIAILLMIFVHCFSSPWWYEGFSINFFPLTEERVNRIGQFCRICVGIFAFITGYGLSLALKQCKGSIAWFCRQRYYKLMKKFYPILAICLLLGVILDNRTAETYLTGNVFEWLYHLLIQGLGLSYLYGTPMFVHEWWYLSAAVIYIFLAPLLTFFVEKFGGGVVLLIWIAVPRITGAGYGHAIYGFSITLLMGIIFYHYNVFERIDAFFAKCGIDTWRQICKLLVAICILYFSYKLYIIGPGVAYDEFHTTLVPLLFIISVRECFLCYSTIRRIFAFFGKHSTNMYFIHTALSRYYLHDFIFSMPWFLLIIFASCIVSLCFSIVLEKFKTMWEEKVKTDNF